MANTKITERGTGKIVGGSILQKDNVNKSKDKQKTSSSDLENQDLTKNTVDNPKNFATICKKTRKSCFIMCLLNFFLKFF